MQTIKLNNYEIAASFSLSQLPQQKMVINTINAHSWVIADKDVDFKTALINSNVLLPDGVGIVWAARLLNGDKITKIAGADLHKMVLEHLDKIGGKCFYIGSSEQTLDKIAERIHIEYPNIEMGSYSPPFKNIFSVYDNNHMIAAINAFIPDVLFVGMTAPKQEKWVEENKTKIDARLICTIGAVFDFYAGNTKRAPQWMINCGLEWLGRLIQEPKRLWSRVFISGPIFLSEILAAKITLIIGTNNKS